MHPTGVSTVSSANTVDAAFTSNTWSVDDWAQMEIAGAVFLPTAGCRTNNDGISDVGYAGFYWSISTGGKRLSDSFADKLFFDANHVDVDIYSRKYFGGAVRLVHNQ